MHVPDIIKIVKNTNVWGNDEKVNWKKNSYQNQSNFKFSKIGTSDNNHTN